MIYELLVLSLLMHWPLHVHRLAKIANDILEIEEQISTSTFSTLLKRLLHAGFVAPHTGPTPFPIDKSSNIYAVTPAGRERFLALMLDTTSPPASYRKIFHIKALHLEFLPIENQLYLLEDYLAYCRQIVRSKDIDIQDIAVDPRKKNHMSPAFQEAAASFMRLKADRWQLELTWALSLREHISARFQR